MSLSADKLTNKVVGQTVKAVNEHNLKGFIDLFSDDAVVTDSGAVFNGLEAIRDWAREQLFDVNGRLEVERESRSDHTFIEGWFSSSGFRGRTTWDFELSNDQIKSLTLEAI